MDIKQALQRTRESWFGRAMKLFDRGSVSDEVWEELEELLIAADVGVGTTRKLIEAVKQQAATEKLKEGPQVREALKRQIVGLLCPAAALANNAAPPRVTMVVGVNGSGTTTSIAKLAGGLKKRGKKVMLAAADTFRAAAIDQLRHWSQKAGADFIAHQPGADPGAVVYDAIQAARRREIDELIIDTSGRLQTKYNLMEELKKVSRVAAKLDSAAPHEVVLVLDATTGQNGLSQARHFTEAVGVTGIFLAKLDGTAKGGIVLAICDELKIPIKYIGTGEKLEDIALFDPKAFVEALLA
ncbi:MAG: signal recognition particle-docking protein FtsY [Chloroflexi bacterium]|nr:signal recognition particle-docking protein FtsY [Chloroflexota bacterium]